MHAVALAGASAMVVVGYCPLACMLDLLWFNRSEPLDWCGNEWLRPRLVACSTCTRKRLRPGWGHPVL